MENKEVTTIIVQTNIKAPVEKVWEYWTLPEHIIKWNFASDDWQTPWAESDLRPGGKFSSRMEAKDGSSGFDFEGTYTTVKTNELIEYEIGDGRKVKVMFLENGSETNVVEKFEAENVYSFEQQRTGWQSILDNFKKYTEAHK